MGARRSHTHTSSIAKSLRLRLALASAGSAHRPPRDRSFLLLAHSAHSHTHIRTRDSFARSLINHYPNSLTHTHTHTHTHTLDRVYPRGGDCSPLPSAALANHSLSISLSRTLCSTTPRSRAHHCTYLSLPRGSCFRSCSAPSSTADALRSTPVVRVAVTRISLLRPSLNCCLLPRR